jgi:two-component system NtrC family sensor kinase
MSAELKQSFDTISEKNEEIAAWNEELKARVKARTRELRQAEEQIIQSQKTAVVTEMSAGIAHQINNPLTSILGFSQFLLTQQTDEGKLRHYLSLIEKGAKRIESLVEELLKFSRQYDNPSFTDIDLNLLIGNTLKVVDRQLKEKRITTQTRFADDLPLATGDPVELQQAVMHLVNNARSAMPEGGELAVGTETVDGGAIKVSIEDSGKGIPEEDLSKVFDLFYTTQNGEETSKRGLGLSVVDRIIRDHKGRISVTSKQGKGSTFTIYLPGLQKTTHLR